MNPSTDEAEQYQLFLRNQLDFEYWRKRQRGREYQSLTITDYDMTRR